MSKGMKEWGKDKSSFSNLPQEVHHVQYPKDASYSTDLDDTMTGIDEVKGHGQGKIKKFVSSQK